MAVTLDTPLSECSHIPSRMLGPLTRMGMGTVRDLLSHFPARYEDFSVFYPIADLEIGERATVRALVDEISSRRSWKKHIMVVEVLLRDRSGTLRALWFNQAYVAYTLRQGQWYNFSGKIAANDEGELYLNNPAFERTSQIDADNTQIYADKHRSDDITIESESDLRESASRHTGRLVPIYPETKGITSKALRFIIFPILQELEPLPEFIPNTILTAEGFPDLTRALHDIHFPRTREEVDHARRRFAFEDLFLLQLVNFKERLALQRERAPAIPATLERVEQLTRALPFALTPSQKKSLWEILQDMREPHPMNRLLQGDVGSGKTVVAALAAILAAEEGIQTALMAPTEVLARQHFETFKKIFACLEEKFSLALLTSLGSEVHRRDSEYHTSKKNLREDIHSGTISIVIGTHALLSASVGWHNLGLAIIDEQHRFGVLQRAKLLHASALTPHFLSMSATPIPRTLTLTVFGNLDLSTITEFPPGRKAVKTYIVPPEKRQGAYAFIRKHASEGRQVFVICPRIQKQIDADSMRINADESNLRVSALYLHRSAVLAEVKTVEEEYEKLSKKIFPDLRVGMLHGKLKPKEKESVMKQFREGAITILVSTTVVEVGVDVPNASIMLIEGSEWFGLAQLYQLRGRVGRGAHESYCFLFTDSKGKSTQERLKAIVEAKNGFELAERDLKLRGPGEFLGQSQTGFPDVAMEALTDPPLVSSSREAAKTILREDPEFAKHGLLREKMLEFERELHLE